MKTQTLETMNGVFPQSLPADLMAAENMLAQLAGVFFPAEAVTHSLTRGFFEKREDGIYGDEEWPDVAARYRILVEHIPAVVFMAFLDQGIGEAYVSPQIEAVLGFTQEEWLNDPVRWYQQIHPEDKARWSIEAAQMFLTGEPLRSVYRVLARDGHTVWFHCEVRMVRRADGRPWFIHGVGFDITELKRAEEALRASEQMLHGLFEFAPDTVVVVDHCGRVARVNAQVERMFGYKRDELLDQPVEVLLPERFRNRHLGYRASYVAEPHTRPMGAGLELYGRRKDGREFPVDIMLSPMKTAEGGMVIAVIRDITMRKQAAEALKRREEELRALTASLLSAQDEERRRIARELHDGTAQNLAGLAMNLSLLLNSPAAAPGSPLFGILSDSLALTEQCSREVRNLSYLTTLFRIVQEGLANVHRHSGSPRAAIQISLTATEVRLELKDEGVGYESVANEENGAGAAPLGVGIPGMRERARQLGGEMEIHPSGSGTTVTVTLPLRSQV